jgi:hypothetical protein
MMNAAAPSPSSSRALTLARWLLPVGGVVALAGYFGPWVEHPVAGLVVMGLDLGEYVKFLPAVRAGQLTLWREAFYWPLAAVSLVYALIVFRADLGYRWWLRAGLVAVALAAALNMLPPAWTPQRLLTPEFQQQTATMAVCLAAVLFSPFLALLPRRLTAVLIALLALAGAAVPVWQFARVLPEIAPLYGHTLAPGWGVYGLAAGFGAVVAGTVALGWRVSSGRSR